MENTGESSAFLRGQLGPQAHGLDESEVIAFVNDLFAQRVNSLRQFADETKAEAEDICRQIEENVEAEADRLIEETGAGGGLDSRAAGRQAADIVRKARQDAVSLVEATRMQVLHEVSRVRERIQSRLDGVATDMKAICPQPEPRPAVEPAEACPRVPASTLSVATGRIRKNGTGSSPATEPDSGLDQATALSATQGIPGTTGGEGDELVCLAEDSSRSREVDIVVTKPVDIVQLIRLRRNLLKVPNLRILRTYGSWKGPTLLTVLMDKPLPLVRILTGMLEVERAHVWHGDEGPAEDFLWGLTLNPRLGGPHGGRIVVTLKPDGEAEDGPGG